MWNWIGLVTSILALALATSAFAADPDWNAVAGALGKQGILMPDYVYRISLPRTDLNVTLDGVALKAGFALGGWVAFEAIDLQAQIFGSDDELDDLGFPLYTMVMADLVLTPDEVTPVMLRLEQGGIDVTALYNQPLRGTPATMSMRILGTGDPVKLAGAIHDALALSKTPLTAAVDGAIAPADIDIRVLDMIMGRQGINTGGIVAYSIPRAENIREYGSPVPPAMGSSISIDFQPLGGGKAAIRGELVLIGSEVAPTLKALADNGIEVTALNGYMVDEAPPLYLMQFWGNDDAQKLARGLRAALDKLHLAKG